MIHRHIIQRHFLCDVKRSPFDKSQKQALAQVKVKPAFEKDFEVKAKQHKKENFENATKIQKAFKSVGKKQQNWRITPKNNK